MKLVLIGDTFPPLRTSGAVQLRDLTRELAQQGHHVTVLCPDPHIKTPYHIDHTDNVEIVRLRAPKTKDVGLARRGLAEWIMPYAMRFALWRSPLQHRDWDGIIWYSPSIFHTPLIAALKRRLQVRNYLIIRDIFPQWTLDMGIMRPGIIYKTFDWFAQKQFQIADVIGVQTPGNLSYFPSDQLSRGTRVEVLQNWIGPAATKPCPIRLDKTKLAGRKIMVYAGNMGVAQGLDTMLDLATQLQSRSDLGFVFVGRGSDAQRLAHIAKDRNLTNTLFFDEVDPDTIPDLYSQCFGGIVALDPRHKSHNIPGKFLTYMQAGLPVFAKINPDNDLETMISDHNVGITHCTEDTQTLVDAMQDFLDQFSDDPTVMTRCKALYTNKFSSHTAAQNVVEGLLQKPCP